MNKMIQNQGQEQQMKDLRKNNIITKHRQLLSTNHQKSISCLYMFGNQIYVGTRLAKLIIYNYENFNPNQMTVVTPHCEVVISIAAQSKYFVVVSEADEDNDLGVWSCKQKQFQTKLTGHKSQVSGVIFLTDQKYLASCSWDGSVRIWNISDFLDVTSFQIPAQYPILVIEELNPEMIAFGGDDCYITIYNWRKRQEVTKVFGHAGSVTFLHASLPLLISGGGDQKLKMWDIKKKDQLFDMRDQQINNNQQHHEPESDKPELLMVREIKKFYDSTLFMTVINDQQQFLFIDRHGERFKLSINQSNEAEIILGENNFLYHDNITGVVRPSKNFILISTAKGDLLEYKLGQKVVQQQIQKK